MSRRPLPSSLILLGVLVLLAILAAAAGGAVLYYQNLQSVRTQADAITSGHWKRGKVALAGYGCGGCHVIPGVSGANGQVGPDLTGIAVRTTLAGVLSNDPANMVRWLQHPQAIVPGNGMPDQRMSDADARDIAAYLYSTM